MPASSFRNGPTRPGSRVGTILVYHKVLIHDQ